MCETPLSKIRKTSDLQSNPLSEGTRGPHRVAMLGSAGGVVFLKNEGPPVAGPRLFELERPFKGHEVLGHPLAFGVSIFLRDDLAVSSPSGESGSLPLRTTLHERLLRQHHMLLPVHAGAHIIGPREKRNGYS